MSGVQKGVSLRASGACVSRFVPLRPRSLVLVEYGYHQSPCDVLALAMNELRRAAKARKNKRITRRLAAIAEGRTERVIESNEPSWVALSEVVGKVLSTLSGPPDRNRPQVGRDALGSIQDGRCNGRP